VSEETSRLPRRGFLRGAGVLGAGALALGTVGLPASPAAGAARGGATSLTGLDVDSSRDDDARVSAPQQVGHGFRLVGLTAPPAADLAVRTSADGASWQPWTPVPAPRAEEGPDDGDEGGADPEDARDPVWVGPSRWLQVRCAGADLAEVTAHALDPEPVASFAALDVDGPFGAPPGRPPIVTRAEWGADESWRNGSPRYTGRLALGVVHHTVNGNDYGPGDGGAIVRSIYRYHTHGRGWNDIGYNFLVDRYGVAYEGRAGGIDKPVVGAHASGFNAVSVGVAVIGTHGEEPMTPEAWGAVSEILAWKAALHDLDPTATVEVSGGRSVTVATLAGHTDVGATECPGGAGYRALGDIRVRAAERKPRLAPAKRLERLAGEDDVATAIAVSQAAFADGEASRAVLATVETFADAAAGGPLAGTGGPVLLTAPDELDERVAAELGRVLTSGGEVLLLGGEAALAPAVEDALTTRWPTRRLAGADRFATATAVAAEVLRREGGTTCLLARARPDDAWADGLTVGAYAAREGVPLLYTETETLPAATRELLRGAGITRTLVIGGSAAVSEDVAATVPSPRRIAGADRTATAVAIAEELWGTDPSRLDGGVLLTNGFGTSAWRNTLVAAPLAARRRAPVLLVRGHEAPEPTASWLARADLDPGDVTIVGAPTAVDEALASRVAFALT